MREGDHKWNDAKKSRLVYLRDKLGMDWKNIAADLGLPANKCKAQHWVTTHQNSAGGNGKPSGRLLPERDERHAAALARNEQLAMSGNLSFMIGDLPPPGRSALDKMRARA